MRLRAVAAVSGLSLALTGCALTSTATPSPEPATAISGKVHGGQQPIAQAHIYLFAAGTSSYGGNGIPASSANASVSVLNSAETGGQSDSVGPYVLTNGSGEFTLPSYSCTAGTPVYLYALGGNPSGGTNSAAGLMAALGTCPVTTSFIEVNEITTVAAAYAFAGFASDATHVSTSGSTLAQTGIVNAFANASNLANVGSGAALATTPAGNGTVPMNEVLTLANILAYCVNSNDAQGAISANCSTLFGYALSGGTSGSTPTDTASAAINIAHNPGANVANLFPLGSGKVAYAISGNYEQPGDFTVQLRFSGGGLDSFKGIAIDAAGDAWVANFSANTVTELSPTGAFLSGASGYSGGSMSAPIEVAIDLSGNAWVANTLQ